MNKVLLDTDIFSEVLKGRDLSVKRVAKSYLSEHGVLTLSAATVLEVSKGLYRTRHPEALPGLLEVFEAHEILPIRTEEARLAGQILAELDRHGIPVGVIDPIIAATAIIYRLPLITGNERHFQRIHDLGFDLEIGNWRHVRV
jgi:tRNA(fMet)-specific endonuclease VapC